MSRRLLLVHAHPDDETITTGATMARYAAEGVAVTLVTSTRGELGEVIPPELAHLATDGTLGDFRVGELAAAMAVLGVPDHRFLGDDASPGRTAAAAQRAGGEVYRDSGMAYDPAGAVVPIADPPPGAFALADPERPAGQLAGVLRAVRPQVVIGYDPGGGYGHPDHVRAHLVTMRALELAAAPGPQSWDVPKAYWVLPAGSEQVTTAIDATAWVAAKVAALRAHRTQVAVRPGEAIFALSNQVDQPIDGREFYRLVRGRPAGPRDSLGRESDLFAY